MDTALSRGPAGASPERAPFIEQPQPDPARPEAAPGTAEAQLDFGCYRKQWFPVGFEVDLEEDALERVTVFDTGYVLFRGPDDALVCLRDRCPHRTARLSDGSLVDGEVECGYHGWRFTAGGECTHIPQLAEGASIPRQASLEPVPVFAVQGIVWIWGGAPEDADVKSIARVPELDLAGMRTIDYTTDLPYSREALVENVLDFAHIHVAHDGVRGGGRREHAGPIAFDIEDRGAEGFRAQFSSQGVDALENGARTSSASVSFVAPGLVHYESEFEGGERRSGLALFSTPLSHDRCRLLYRAYSNFWPQADLDRPRWREHLHQMHLLEQDMDVVLGQVDELGRGESPLKDTWLPIASSDQLVVHHRRWIDAHAAETPGAMGWHERGDVQRTRAPRRMDRLNLHTRHCSACRKALAELRQQRRLCLVTLLIAPLITALLPLPFNLLVVAIGVTALIAMLRSHVAIDSLTRDPLSQVPVSIAWW